MASLTVPPLGERPSRGGYALAVRIRRPSSPSGPKRANPRLLAWLPGSDSCSRGAVSRLPTTAHEGEATSSGGLEELRSRLGKRHLRGRPPGRRRRPLDGAEACGAFGPSHLGPLR